MLMIRTNDKLLYSANVTELTGETDKPMNIFTITGPYFAKYVPVSLENKAEELIIMPRFSATIYNDYCMAVL